MAVRNTESSPALFETVKGLTRGLYTYGDPDSLPHTAWSAAENVYTGLFGSVRRARFVKVVDGGVTSGFASASLDFVSLFSANDTVKVCLLGDTKNVSGGAGTLWSFNTSSSYAATIRTHPFLGSPHVDLADAWSRLGFVKSLVFEANGKVKLRSRGLNFGALENWGIDAPDTSPAVTKQTASVIDTIANSGATRTGGVSTIKTTAAHHLFPAGVLNINRVTIAGCSDSSFNGTFIVESAGFTSTQFTYLQPGLPDVGAATAGNGSVGSQTNSVGRSYRWAWRSSATLALSAPSPATIFQLYSGQDGTLEFIQPGTIAVSSTGLVTGTGTAFTAAWIGRKLWIQDSSDRFYVSSVASATSLQLQTGSATVVSGKKFQIYDPQSDQIVVYMTADGGSIYHRTDIFYQTAISFFANETTLSLAGLTMYDGAAVEPPSAPFDTTQSAQFFNVPPPKGKFLHEYQSRALVFGVSGAEQTIFYSNIEQTEFGLLPDCFAPLNQLTFPLGTGKLNGAGSLPTGLILWSNEKHMFKITGLLQDNTANADDFVLGSTVQRLPYELGCGSAYSPTSTPLGIFWLTDSKEVYLFNDQYAPRNVGLPIQPSLNQLTLDITRGSYYRSRGRSWFVLGDTVTTFVLDLDLLEEASSSAYLFSPGGAQPVWYQFNKTESRAGPLLSITDVFGETHLIWGQVDNLIELDYNGSSFKSGSELTPAGSVQFHSWGNQHPESIKKLRWMRFNTNRTPTQAVTDGWTFRIECLDDDFYTAASPLVVTLTPGVDSVEKTGGPGRAFEYSTVLFKFGGVKFAQGRRLNFKVTFPTVAGDFEFRGYQLCAKALKPR